MSRTLWPLAALAMLAVIVAGCSNAPAGTGSSGGNSTAAPISSVAADPGGGVTHGCASVRE
jgi:hypothetical protein